MFRNVVKLAALALLALVLASPSQSIAQTNRGSNGLAPSDLGPAVTAYATKADTTAATMLPAPGAGVRNYVYQAACFNVSATATVAFIKDGATTIAVVVCPPSGANGGSMTFSPPIRQPTAGTALTMTAGASVTTAYFYMGGRTAR